MKHSTIDEKILEVLKNPVAFSIFFLNIEPFPYQAKFLLDESKRIVFRAGRQVGKTTITAIKALWWAFTKPEQIVLVLAPTWRQSSWLFLKIREMIRRNEWLYSKIKRETMTMLEFDNGSRIYCLPSGRTGDTIRGFTADLVIVDEAAYVSEEVFLAIEPAVATTNGTIILLSTPADKAGRFWEACSSPYWKQYHVPSRMSPLISKEFLEEQKMIRSEAEFLREFEGEFTEESEYILIKLREIWDAKEMELPAGWKGDILSLGVDIARFGLDETVAILVETDRDIFKVVKIWSWSKTDLMATVGRIREIIDAYQPQRVQIDDTGLGGGVVDRLREEGYMVRGINFGAKATEPKFLNMKAEIFWNLKLLFEKRKISIPDHPKLINQLRDLLVDYTSSGKMKIEVDSPKSPDYADALALACYLKQQPKLVLGRVKAFP